MKTVGFTLDKLDLVIDTFESAGADRVVDMVQDPILEKAKSFDIIPANEVK